MEESKDLSGLEKTTIGKNSLNYSPELVNSIKKLQRKRRIEIASANELLKKPFLNEYEVSAITGRAVATLRNDRHLRRGLPYLIVSERSIRYRTPDVMNFMEARPVTFNEVSE